MAKKYAGIKDLSPKMRRLIRESCGLNSDTGCCNTGIWVANGVVNRRSCRLGASYCVFAEKEVKGK